MFERASKGNGRSNWRRGYNAQIGNINQQSAKIGELAADDFVQSKRPNAKLLHPKDIGTSISKPGDFDMVYEVEEPPPGEIIIVEAKGGSSPLGTRKIEIWHISKGQRNTLQKSPT